MKEIPLTRGQVAIIDDADYGWLSKFKWHAHYNRRTGRYDATRHKDSAKQSNGKWTSRTVTMQREIMNPPSGFEVDHKNGCTLDNRRDNLRVCTRQQNSLNRGLRRDSKLGVKGVQRSCWPGSAGFIARIMHEGKRINLGTFRTIDEARHAYNSAALKYHGEFARLSERKGY